MPHRWQSGAGGLYLSLAIAPDLPLSNSAPPLRNCGIPALLKWPNDLVLAGGKLGGILTETRARSGLIAKAVVGAGINWANEVPPTSITLQSFQANLLQPPIFCCIIAVWLLANIVFAVQKFTRSAGENPDPIARRTGSTESLSVMALPVRRLLGEAFRRSVGE